MSDQVTLSITFPDGTKKVIRTKAFELVTFTQINLSEKALTPHSYSFPAGNGWTTFETISVLGEALTREEGTVLKTVGTAVMKTMNMGRDLITKANSAFRDKLRDELGEESN